MASRPITAADGGLVAHRGLIDHTARFSQTFLRWLDGSGALTYPRLRVLELLHCRGPAMMRDLASASGLTPRNLTTLADALEHEGLIRRTSHPDDRRATLLELTETGWQAADNSLTHRLGEIATLFDALTATQRQQLDQILTTLIDTMTASPCATQRPPAPPDVPQIATSARGPRK